MLNPNKIISHITTISNSVKCVLNFCFIWLLRKNQVESAWHGQFLYWFFYFKSDTKFSLCSHWYQIDLVESTWFRPSFTILILATSLLILSSVFADKNLDHIFLLIFQSICSRMCKIGFFFFHVFIFEKFLFTFFVWNFNILFLYISFDFVFQLCARCCVFTAL